MLTLPLAPDPITPRFLADVEGSLPGKPGVIAKSMGVETLKVLAALNVLTGRGRARAGQGFTYFRTGGR